MMVRRPFGVLKKFFALRRTRETSRFVALHIGGEDQAADAHAIEKPNALGRSQDKRSGGERIRQHRALSQHCHACDRTRRETCTGIEKMVFLRCRSAALIVARGADSQIRYAKRIDQFAIGPRGGEFQPTRVRPPD